MELFECARCHLGSWAAILAARQRLLPALWALCGFAGALVSRPSVPLLPHGSEGSRLRWGSMASGCKTLAQPSQHDGAAAVKRTHAWSLGARRNDR